MNNLVEINNHKLQVREFNNQRVVTFNDIDTIHERPNGTAKRNFTKNKDKFIKDVDYFEIRKSEVGTNFVQTYGFNKFAPSGVLITESGYLMLVKSLTDDLAWKVQRSMVNNYFRGKQLINSLNELSPQLQLLINLELEQKNIKKEIAATKQTVDETNQTVQSIKDTIIQTDNDWRNWVNNQMSKISFENKDYKEKRSESYKLLEERARCRLRTRLNNLKRRLLQAGASKTEINNTNYLDVIEADVRLKEIYTMIIKEMVIKYV